jgi:hypothetical protein
MIAAVRSATVFGVEGRPVTVEVHVSTGLPAFQIVGLPDEACRESRDRVRAAVLSSELQWPSCRVTVNLAPSSQRKGGSGLDLAIAVGFLAANNQVPVAQLEGLGFVGELGLDGSMRQVSGVAPMVAAMGDVRPVVPLGSFREAQGVAGDGVRVARTLREVVDALNAEAPVAAAARRRVRRRRAAAAGPCRRPRPGHGAAGAGGRGCGCHHMLLVGPPGFGQDDAGAAHPRACCRRSSGDVSLEATMVHSAAGVRPARRWPGAARHRSVRRTTAARWCRSSAAAAPACGPARSAWPTAACCSWTSWASSPPPCSTAAPAAGGRRHPARSCSCVGRPAGEVPLGGRHQPVPVRRRSARRCECDDGAGCVSAPPVGAVPRPFRPAGGRHAARRRRPARQRWG